MTTQTLQKRAATQPALRSFHADVIEGLSRPRKTLPCKYFYDERGSKLFDQICDLKEYYPTRTEQGILRQYASQMVELFGTRCGLIEYGSGSSVKTRLILEQLRDAVYFPVDISRDYLLQTIHDLSADYPHVEMVPVCADFTKAFSFPRSRREVLRRVVYFSGSTIGNFRPAEAVLLLRQIASLIGSDGGLLIGVDLKKDRAILEPAYDDAAGVTAAFNKNLLVRINRDLGGNFDLNRFRHLSFYNEEKGRVEMHLVSLQTQEVRIGADRFFFSPGECICTEYSHKYSLEEFARLAAQARLTVRQVWCDRQKLFSVQYLEPIACLEA